LDGSEASGSESSGQPDWVPPADYLQFAGACSEGPRISIAFGGDLLLHRELQRQVYAESEAQGAGVLWADIADLLAAPDLTYLNFEGVMAPGLDRDFLDVPDPGRSFDKLVYTGYPRFNYHPSVARDLARAGIDLVSTANNHALDRGPVGVDRTIAALRKAKLDYVGTRTQDGPRRWQAFTTVAGQRIAWIACTNNTNRIADDLEQVLYCGRGAEVRDLIQRLLARGRFHKRRAKADAVIVTPHWGKQYMHVPRERERGLAESWIEAGALAVIGSHPHVVQPWEKIVTEDGREGLVFYSLGNFASHQPELSRRTSLLLYLDLVVSPVDEGELGEGETVKGSTESSEGGKRKPEGEGGGKLQIAGVRYLPLHVRRDGAAFFVESVDRRGAELGTAAHSRALMVALLGAGNLVTPDADKRGDPHCDPSWRPIAVPEWAELDEPFYVPGTEPELEAETGTGD